MLVCREILFGHVSTFFFLFFHLGMPPRFLLSDDLQKAYLRISALNFKANRNLRIVFAQPDTTIISLTDSPEETPSRYRGRRS